MKSPVGSTSGGLPPPARRALPVHDFPLVAGAVPASAEDGAGAAPDGTLLPHVVAWNLTRRCNLACSHCYISAGSWHGSGAELTTDESFRVLDDVLSVNPSLLLILSGGEPLVRHDVEAIAERATTAGATVVVGTNGIGLTHDRIRSLKDAGVRGVAVSVDSLKPAYHDRFRHGAGALAGTLDAVDRLVEHELDFIVQTSLTRGNRDGISSLAAWAAKKGAVSFNLYFLVPTGRGRGMEGLTPAENEEVLSELVELERLYRGRMMVRSKCQPQLMRHVLEADDGSPLLNYETRCPCGVHYCRITPEGKVTPCPYMPAQAGDLTRESFREVWTSSAIFKALRGGGLTGRCGKCEYRKVCGGCRARAYAQSGDPLGPDDSCEYNPTGEVPVVEPGPDVTYGRAAELELSWSPDARERLNRIPSFVRGVVTRRVEDFARARGYAEVTASVMAEVRRALPVDFSKRLPFFLREEEGEADGEASEAAGA